MKIALLQLSVTTDKMKNLSKAKRQIITAAENGAQYICLPEMFNCPYDPSVFEKMAETDNGVTVNLLKELAKEYNVHIIGGTIPERVKNLIFNTCYIIGPTGDILEKHRKAHLFDVDIPDGITFKESDVLAAGNKPTVVKTPTLTFGVAICYDMRFPEMIRSMVKKGADVVFIPAAFNTVTGPAHWHTLAKARALDNQIYMVLCSPARNPKLSYQAYGHSLIANPWGEIEKELKISEDILYHTLDLNKITETRQSLPLLKHLRNEIY